MNLTGRNIVLGVTGGIAAYKSAEVVSRLRHGICGAADIQDAERQSCGDGYIRRARRMEC